MKSKVVSKKFDKNKMMSCLLTNSRRSLTKLVIEQ